MRWPVGLSDGAIFISILNMQKLGKAQAMFLFILTNASAVLIAQHHKMSLIDDTP